MHRFVQGQDRAQTSLLPASLEDYVDAVNPARIIEAFVEALDLGALGFAIVSLNPPGAVNSCLLDPHADVFTRPRLEGDIPPSLRANRKLAGFA